MKAPNLTIIPGWQCLVGAGEQYVESKTTNGKFYRVFISSNERDPHTCNCPHFVHRGLATHFETCKHIDEALVDVCGWNSVISGGPPDPCNCSGLAGSFAYALCEHCDGTGNQCPSCSGRIEAVNIGV